MHGAPEVSSEPTLMTFNRFLYSWKVDLKIDSTNSENQSHTPGSVHTIPPAIMEVLN